MQARVDELIAEGHLPVSAQMIAQKEAENRQAEVEKRDALAEKLKAEEDKLKAEAEKRQALAVAEQAVYHAIKMLENTDWSVSEQHASLLSILDGLHAAKQRLCALPSQDSAWNQRCNGHSRGVGALEMVHTSSGQKHSSVAVCRAAPGSGDAHQLDPFKYDPGWATLRADPDAKRLCELIVRLYVLQGFQRAKFEQSTT
jgi:hypothetical protein